MDHSAHIHTQHVPVLPNSASALEWAGFAAIFSYSFIVSFHCFGMCGPLACSLLSRSSLSPLKSTALYNLGRGISYCAAGALVGLASSAFKDVWPDLTRLVSIVFGALVCIWAVTSLLGVAHTFPKNPFAKALGSVQRLVVRLPSSLSALGLGLLTIFLPCMTLHPLLLLSAAQQDSISGSMTMLAFYAGTLPAMVIATYVPTLFSGKYHVQRFVRFGQIFLFFSGLLTIARSYIHH